MECNNKNFFHDTTISFPRGGFWLLHLFGAFFIFLLGMRFAIHRVPLSMLTYRLIRMLLHR